MHAYTHTHRQADTHTDRCTQACMYAPIYIYTHVCMYTSKHTDIDTHRHRHRQPATHTHACTHTDIDTQTDSHIHTHTHRVIVTVRDHWKMKKEFIGSRSQLFSQVRRYCFCHLLELMLRNAWLFQRRLSVTVVIDSELPARSVRSLWTSWSKWKPQIKTGKWARCL